MYNVCVDIVWPFRKKVLFSFKINTERAFLWRAL